MSANGLTGWTNVANGTPAGVTYTNATTTTLTANGSSTVALYYYQCVVTSGGCSANSTSATLTISSCAPLNGTYTVPGSYATLTAAATALHNCGVSGPVKLVLNSYVGAGETYPILFQSIPGSSSTNTVTIYENTGGTSITSANATGTLNLSGCKYVIFDGRLNALGSTEDLVIANTNTSGYTIQYINDACNNTLTYCNIQGVCTTTTKGVVFFSTAVSTGNGNNIISFCDIHDGATTPYDCINSTGTNTAGMYNDSITVSNCKIYNFYVNGSTAKGIDIETGNDSWTITGNSFYQTVTRTPTISTKLYSIYINCPNGNGFTVNQNHLGGSSSNCGGTWTETGTQANTFLGIYANVGQTPVTNIQGNTINKFSIATTPTSATGTNVFVGIRVDAGSVNIGTTANNTIGSSTAAGTILITYGSPAATAYSFVLGIILFNISATDTVNVGSPSNGNFIGGLSLIGTSAATVYFYGLSYGSTNNATNYVITNNQLGNGVASCMLNAATVVTFDAGIVDESATTGTGTVTISNNYIGNFTNSSANTNSITYGIMTSLNSNTITNNTIANMSSLGNGTYITPIGIDQASTTANQTVSGNQIYNLTNSAAGATAITIDGIYCPTGPTTGTNVISRNYIYNLTSTSTSATSQLCGLNIMAGTATISNNMITIGNGVATGYDIIGLWDQSANATTYYFNSIYIGGTTATNTSTYAFYTTGTNTRLIENNIFYNARCGNTSKQYAYYESSKTGRTSNYNDLYASCATYGYVGYYNGTTNCQTLGPGAGTWENVSGQDANSKALTDYIPPLLPLLPIWT